MEEIISFIKILTNNNLWIEEYQMQSRSKS